MAARAPRGHQDILVSAAAGSPRAIGVIISVAKGFSIQHLPRTTTPAEPPAGVVHDSAERKADERKTQNHCADHPQCSSPNSKMILMAYRHGLRVSELE